MACAIVAPGLSLEARKWCHVPPPFSSSRGSPDLTPSPLNEYSVAVTLAVGGSNAGPSSPLDLELGQRRLRLVAGEHVVGPGLQVLRDARGLALLVGAAGPAGGLEPIRHALALHRLVELGEDLLLGVLALDVGHLGVPDALVQGVLDLDRHGARLHGLRRDLERQVLLGPARGDLQRLRGTRVRRAASAGAALVVVTAGGEREARDHEGNRGAAAEKAGVEFAWAGTLATGAAAAHASTSAGSGPRRADASSTGAAWRARSRRSFQVIPSATSAGMPRAKAVATSTAWRMIP